MTAGVAVPASAVSIIVVVIAEAAPLATAACGHRVAFGVSEPAAVVAAAAAPIIVVTTVVVARSRIGSAAAIVVVLADETTAFVSFRTLISGHVILLGWAIFALQLMKRHEARRAEPVCLLQQPSLSLQKAATQRGGVDAGCLRLGEDARSGRLFLGDMVSDLLGEDLEPGGLERILDIAGEQFDDQQLGAVMLDLGFVERVLGLIVVRLAAGGVEDLFFEQSVERQFDAGLTDDRDLALVRGGLELCEQSRCPSMISLEQINGVGSRIGCRAGGLARFSRLTRFSLLYGCRRLSFGCGWAREFFCACKGFSRRRGSLRGVSGLRWFWSWRSGVVFRRLHGGSCRKGTRGKSVLPMRVPAMRSVSNQDRNRKAQLISRILLCSPCAALPEKLRSGGLARCSLTVLFHVRASVCPRGLAQLGGCKIIPPGCASGRPYVA